MHADRRVIDVLYGIEVTGLNGPVGFLTENSLVVDTVRYCEL